MSVPVLLVSTPGAYLRSESIRVAAEHTVDEVIKYKGNISADGCIAVVDMKSADKERTVIASLYLRNSGRTALIGSLNHIPIDLIVSINSFVEGRERLGAPVTHELLLMDDAIEEYGDISKIVRLFELEYLN